LGRFMHGKKSLKRVCAIPLKDFIIFVERNRPAADVVAPADLGERYDRRFRNGGAHEAVETEVLSPRLIVQIVRDRLNALLPEPLETVLAREEEERERLPRLLARR